MKGPPTTSHTGIPPSATPRTTTGHGTPSRPSPTARHPEGVNQDGRRNPDPLGDTGLADINPLPAGPREGCCVLAGCLLEARGVWKSYGGRPALRGVDLCVPPGRVVGLVGPNGAGKTTLIRVSLGILRRDGGEVRLFGRDPFRDASSRERVGVVFERPVLPGGVPVYQVLLHAARIRGAGEAEVRRAIRLAGLAGHEWKPFDGLSAGLKQRAALAHALVAEPSLVVADEPTSNLDPVERLRVLELVRSLARDEGVSWLFSSHVLPEVARVADELVVLREGRVAARGRPEEIVGGLARARVRVSDLEAAARLIEEAGLSVRREGLGLLVEAGGVGDQWRLLEALARASRSGVVVYSVDFVEPSVEAMLVEGG